MPIPDVVIAGAAKCGTTALALALHHHPDFAVGHEKEPRYFTGASPTFTGPLSDRYNRSLIDNELDYRRNFAGVGDARTVDASTDYLHHPHSADRIQRANPDARVIIGLRHPLRRAWSEHMHLRRAGGETESFDRALHLEGQRRDAGWIPLFAHVDRSRFSPGVAAFLEAFGRERVFIFTHEQLAADPRDVFERLSEFLDVSEPLVPMGRHNVGGMPRSRRVYDWVRADRGPVRAIRHALGRSLSGSARRRVRALIDRVNLDRSEAPSDPATAWLMTRTVDDLPATEAMTGLDLAQYRVGLSRA